MTEEYPLHLLPMEFRSVVNIVWGEHWADIASAAFGVRARTLKRMATGERNYHPSPEIARELRSIVANQIERLERDARPQDVAFVKRVLNLTALDLSRSSRP